MLSISTVISAAEPIKVALVGDHFAVGNSDGAFTGLGTPISEALGNGYEVKTFGGNDFSSVVFLQDASPENSKAYDPDYVVISLGTKDCQTADVNAAWDTYAENIGTLAAAYRAQGQR